VALELPVEFGNAGEVPTHGTGWFVGWSAWTHAPLDLRFQPATVASTGLCIKWYHHAGGHPHGEVKPVSEGRTISILVGAPGGFRLDFSRSAAFEADATLTHVLRRPGDYAVWGAGVFHRTWSLEPSTILSVRWEPVR
jgi:hypothetical protein